MQILILSVVLQIYVLATPFYMQIVVDNAIAKNDHDLLLVLALVLLLAMRGVTTRVRVAGLIALAGTLILVLMLVLRGSPGTIGGRLAESFDPKLPIAYRVS